MNIVELQHGAVCLEIVGIVAVNSMKTNRVTNLSCLLLGPAKLKMLHLGSWGHERLWVGHLQGAKQKEAWGQPSDALPQSSNVSVL